MQPNIVFLLADDLGWRDLSCYGSTFYETPNLDRLALQGMRFTDAYAACPVCSPSRASLLTGKYPARVGITNWIYGQERGKLLEVPFLDHLPDNEFTLPEALREGGYQTWHVGKWHLGGAESRTRGLNACLPSTRKPAWTARSASTPPFCRASGFSTSTPRKKAS